MSLTTDRIDILRMLIEKARERGYNSIYVDQREALELGICPNDHTSKTCLVACWALQEALDTYTTTDTEKEPQP